MWLVNEEDGLVKDLDLKFDEDLSFDSFDDIFIGFNPLDNLSIYLSWSLDKSAII